MYYLFHEKTPFISTNTSSEHIIYHIMLCRSYVTIQYFQVKQQLEHLYQLKCEGFKSNSSDVMELLKSGKWSCRELMAFTHTLLITSLDQEEGKEVVMNKTMLFGNVNKVFVN